MDAGGLSQPFWKRHEWALGLAILVAIAAITLLDRQHNYWNNAGRSAMEIQRQMSMLGIFALGAAVVIIAGGIDLSQGSMIAFSGTVCAGIMLALAPEEMNAAQPIPKWVLVASVAGALGTGFLVGSLHAWLITVIRLPPFVATLATLVGLRSLGRVLCENLTAAYAGGRSTQIQIYDASFRQLGRDPWIPFTLFVLLAIITWVLLSKTVTGRHLYAMGGNEAAARLCGIRTERLKWLAYTLSAMLSSLAGVLYICDQSVADPQTLGRGYELNAIAASVVGGCSLAGGVGTVTGTVLGALFLRVIVDGVAKIIKTGADVYEGLIVGGVVILAVAFTQTGQGSTRRERVFGGALGVTMLLNVVLLAGVMGTVLAPKGADGSRLTTGLATAVVAGVALLGFDFWQRRRGT